jgi:long-chain acyl-CoA synthetase
MLFHKAEGLWHSLTATDVQTKVRQLAASFVRMGNNTSLSNIESAEKIAIIANNRPEWVIVDFAAQLSGAVLVPIYPSVTEQEWSYMLQEAKVSTIFISDRHIYKKLKHIQHEITSLKHVYCFDPIEGVTHWSELLQPFSNDELEGLELILQQIKPEDLATIIYTSGTTGLPKGVMLSHRNILSNVLNCMEVFDFCDHNQNVLSFLPLNHIFERTVLYIYLNKGVSVYFAEGFETIGQDLKDVKPVVFTTVPRLLEKVFEKIDAKGNSLKFDIDRKPSAWYTIQHRIADRLVYKKWRDAIGGKIKAIVTGSAACQVKLLRLFTAANIVVMEGYGLTETSPVISVNRYDPNKRKFGTVGVVIKDMQVRLGDDGEIICKGPNVMMGYYKHPEWTDEVMKDGWFHTGDIGQFVDNKFLKITDRKKEIFKISGGKYVAPLPIENKMKESPYIEQIMVVGSNEKFAGALIVPAFEKIKEYFAQKGINIDPGVDLTKDKDALKLIRQELDKFNGLFSAHEQVKKFQLLPHEWTIEGGELTATMKLRRKKIMEKYEEAVMRIYA